MITISITITDQQEYVSHRISRENKTVFVLPTYIFTRSSKARRSAVMLCHIGLVIVGPTCVMHVCHEMNRTIARKLKFLLIGSL